MKTLICCSLLSGVLAAGLAVGLRPRPAAQAAANLLPPAPAPRPLAGTERTEAPGCWPAAEAFTPTRRREPVVDRDRAFMLQLTELIAHDPARAGQLVLAREPGAGRDEGLRHFIRHWAATDLGSVVAWVGTLTEENDRQIAARAVTAQVAQDDPAGAIELAQLFHTGLDDGSVEHLMQLWTEASPREALDWTVRRPAGPWRDRLLARVAHVRAQREPAEAAGLVLDHMIPGDTRDEALMGVVHQWARRDPAGATAWVAQFSAGRTHPDALTALETARQPR
jgi:hypothetical protein